MTPREIVRDFVRKRSFVKHEEIGSEACGITVKVPAYARQVKLFAYREAPDKSIRVILASNPDIDEGEFQEAVYALRADFGEDKIAMALSMYQRVVDMGCLTRRTAFDTWFFVLEFCKKLTAMGFRWFTQAARDSRFTVRGKDLLAEEIVEKTVARVAPVRNLPGFKALALRAEWPGFGTVLLVVVHEKQRKPYVLVTDDLNVPIKGVITAYKSRWRIEVTFREEKQNLNLEGFRVRKLPAVKAHLVLIFLAHTLLRLIAQIDDALMAKSLGWMKEKVVNVLALAERLAQKTGLEFVDTFDLYYLADLVKSRKKRNKARASGMG